MAGAHALSCFEVSIIRNSDRRPNHRWSQPAGRGVITSSQPAYEIRPRKDHRGFDLISDVLPFRRPWYGEPNATATELLREVSQPLASRCDSRL